MHDKCILLLVSWYPPGSSRRLDLHFLIYKEALLVYTTWKTPWNDLRKKVYLKPTEYDSIKEETVFCTDRLTGGDSKI